jgi:hypothetical protein
MYRARRQGARRAPGHLLDLARELHDRRGAHVAPQIAAARVEAGAMMAAKMRSDVDMGITSRTWRYRSAPAMHLCFGHPA